MCSSDLRVEVLTDANGKTEYRLATQEIPHIRIWHAFRKNVPADAQTLACVGVPEDRVEEVQRDFPRVQVLSLEEIQVEHALLSEIRRGSLPPLPLSWHQRITSSARSLV